MSKKKKKFFASDHHFFHENIINPQWDKEGSRTQFSSIQEMNDYIIEKHNSVVGENDLTYFGGDVFLPGKLSENETIYDILNKMNGEKILILGNHDTAARIKIYQKYFKKILGYEELLGCIIVSHVPVHVSQVENRFVCNIHGHVHHKTLDDNRYFNMSMEAIDYTPIELTKILHKIKER